MGPVTRSYRPDAQKILVATPAINQLGTNITSDEAIARFVNPWGAEPTDVGISKKPSEI